MTTVRVKENEPFEAALRRFKRTVEKTGLLTELRAREYYEKPTTERKRKLAAAHGGLHVVVDAGLEGQYIRGGSNCARSFLWWRLIAAASLRLRSVVGFS